MYLRWLCPVNRLNIATAPFNGKLNISLLLFSSLFSLLFVLHFLRECRQQHITLHQFLAHIYLSNRYKKMFAWILYVWALLLFFRNSVRIVTMAKLLSSLMSLHNNSGVCRFSQNGLLIPFQWNYLEPTNQIEQTVYNLGNKQLIQ